MKMLATTELSPDMTTQARRVGPPILKVEHLSREFGGVLAIGDLSFTIAAGDIQMARGHYEEASKVYESVAVILDDPEITPEALEKAVDAWRKANKTAEADKTLNKLKSRYPEYKLHLVGP